MIILQNNKTKEKVVVHEDEREGYGTGWTLLEENVARPRLSNLHRVDGRWRFDRDAFRKDRIRAMAPEDQFDTLMDLVDDLLARVIHLENIVETQDGL